MIRIALVEDDEDYRREFLTYLEQYERESGQRFRISVFTDGDEITEGYAADYDLILMDIAMRFMDGMTAAEHIRALDSEVVIIFITNMPQFVMKGYAGLIAAAGRCIVSTSPPGGRWCSSQPTEAGWQRTAKPMPAALSG